MACPACNRLAIPLFGTAGVLLFLAPERAVIALLSIALLAVALALRLRATRTCRLTNIPTDRARSRSPRSATARIDL